MKRLLICIFSIAIIACDNDEDKKTTQNKLTEVKNTAVTGQWRVTYFFDTDHEETNNFTGFTFVFAENGTVTATNNSISYNGSWSVTDSGSTDDNNDLEDLDFNLSFTNPPDFEELSDDWEIISLSGTKIELRDVSGGNGGTDLLTFEKI
jgi:hypothetical protein